VIVDPIDTVMKLDKFKIVRKSPPGTFVVLYDPKIAYKTECSYNLYGKRIGYIDRSDLLLIKAIAYGYRIPPNAYEVLQVPPDKLDKLDKLLDQKQYDMVFAYMIPESPLFSLIKTQPITAMSFKGIDLSRLQVFHPFLTLSDMNTREAFALGERGTELKVLDKDKNGPFLQMEMNVLEVRTKQANVETFITRLDLNPTSIDPSYRCYGDPSIKQKALCDSIVDASQIPKTQETIWDQPCIEDTDCPYFQANKNYPNNRGRCLSGGICEMPVGVKRVAYRKVDTKMPYAPFCYGCKDPLDPECCTKQQKPDYAFPNDQQDRQQAGRKTFIPMD